EPETVPVTQQAATSVWLQVTAIRFTRHNLKRLCRPTRQPSFIRTFTRTLIIIIIIITSWRTWLNSIQRFFIRRPTAWPPEHDENTPGTERPREYQMSIPIGFYVLSAHENHSSSLLKISWIRPRYTYSLQIRGRRIRIEQPDESEDNDTERSK
ncbi:PREDICTED: uncharacterized protein LOC107185280, partial [Dufourea novaeangliae]|uniref:uncharacterized protein LOC107185280 n=1 Tax=Dufourea novaeangliae TaxID=178035 RepID=UPI000767AA0C